MWMHILLLGEEVLVRPCVMGTVVLSTHDLLFKLLLILHALIGLVKWWIRLCFQVFLEHFHGYILG